MLQKIIVKRMPVILPAGYEKDWIKDSLSLTSVQRMLNPFNPEKMNAYPVNDSVNTPELNDLLMIIPIGEKLQSEVQLIRKINPYQGYHYKVKHSPDWYWGEKRMKLK